jgi:hypothetical protein
MVAALVAAPAFALAQGAPGPGRSMIGFSVGGLPVPLFLGTSVSASGSRVVVPHVALRADIQLHTLTSFGGITALSAPGTFSASASPCPPATTCYSTYPFRVIAAAAGVELFEYREQKGFYGVLLAGPHHLRSLNGDRSAVVFGWQAGGGVLMPVGHTAVSIEARYVRLSGVDRDRRRIVPLTFGLRF